MLGCESESHTWTFSQGGDTVMFEETRQWLASTIWIFKSSCQRKVEAGSMIGRSDLITPFELSANFYMPVS